MSFTLILAAVTTVSVVADLLDVITTEKCIAKGAVETNTFLVGTKPTAEALYLRDSLVYALCVAPSIVSLILGNTPLAYGTLVGPAVFAAKHFLGYRAGKLWLAGKAPDPNAPKSAWQKFIGL